MYLGALTIYLLWVAFAIVVALTLNPSVGGWLLWTSFAFIVFILFYKSRGVVNRWPWLGNLDAKISDKDFDKAREHLERTNEKIYKAHPDTAVALIAKEMQIYEKELGHANLNKHFDHYQELSGLLTKLNWQIDNSRQSGDQRDELWRDIAEGADFKALLKYFDELRSSIMAIRESIEEEKAESEKKKREFSEMRLRWWIAILLAISASLDAFII